MSPGDQGAAGGRILTVNALPRRGPVTRDLAVPAQALAVGAHPDDVEFGCGGTLAKWAAAGCVLHHLVLTDGSRGSWEAGADRSGLVARRHAEQEEAARALGGGAVTFLDHPDGDLAEGPAVREEICRVLRAVRPDVVLGHDPWRRYRLHPDHRAAGFLLTDALVAARDPLFHPEQGLAPHRPATLLLFEADEPNHVEGIGDTLAVKLAALRAHGSQHATSMGEPAAFAAHLAEQAAEHGALAGLAAGEAFHRLDEI